MKRRLPIVVSSLLLAAAIAGVLAISSGEATPKQTTAGPNPASAVQISGAGELIGGPMARGQIGDYLLSNSEIQVVIQKPERNMAIIGEFGGQIIDADIVRTGPDPERDAFEEWAFGINVENTAHYTSVTIVNDGTNGQPAVIRATGVDDLLNFINPSSQVAGFGFPFPAAFDDTDLPVTISTDYILAPNSDYVEVQTTVANTDTNNPIDTFLTEFFNGSSQAELFLPGYGFGFPLITSACPMCNFASWSGFGDTEGVAYGYIHNIDAGDIDTTDDTTTFNTEGVTIPLLDENTAFALIGAAPANYYLAPQGQSGDQVTVTRYFAVGEEVGDIVDTRNQILGYTTGTLSGTVTRGGSPVEGADVVVIGAQADGPGGDTPDPSDDVAKNVVAQYRTDALGNYAGTLPPGSYTVQASVDGHMPASPDPGSVTITASNTTTQDFTIPASGRLQVTIVDENNNPIAGRVSVVGFDQNPDPGNSQNLLGGIIQNRTKLFADTARDSQPFGVARTIYVDESGDSGEIFLEPGDYQVVVSHGTEYSVAKEDVTLTGGSLTTVNTQIARVVDTSGFVAGDFHVHAQWSPDSMASGRNRVVSGLTEGMEFFAWTDHEYRTDAAQEIADAGATGLTSAVVSNENTTPDYGHFIGWPVTLDTSKSNNGTLDWGSEGVPPVAPAAGQDFPSLSNYMMSPAEIFDNLLADPGTEVVQINHMDTFFGPSGLSIDTAYIPPRDFGDPQKKRLDPSIPNLFDSDFTALEVWQGTGRNEILNRLIGKNLGDWFNLINQGIVRTGYAVSDSHQMLNPIVAYPRSYLASSTDSPGAVDPEELATNTNAGRVVTTNGPFIQVTSSAASTSESGGLALGEPTLISTTNGAATIDVNIESPLWAEFDRVEYYVNTVPTPDYYDNLASTPPYWNVAPTTVQTAGVDFTVNTINDFPAIPGAQHLEASAQLNLTGLTDDTWVVVVVRGTDNVSEPMFPVIPNNLKQSTNLDLDDLTDGNLGEDGIPTMAFSNPLFISVGGTAGFDTHPVDNDRDGCTNSQELGLTTSLGGNRSPSLFWDFFDTPNAAGVRDKAIVISDINRVVSRFGSSTTPGSKATSYAQALGIPPAAPAYHAGFDRTAAGAVTGAPDGSITVSDITRIVAQFGHNC